MPILYEHPLSPYSQKVKIALREKGVEFELRLPEGVGAGSAGGDFASGNPRSEVPLFIDGDAAIFDSTIILQYVEDRWPQPSLLPASPSARAKARTIEEVMDTHFEAITWGLAELSWFRRAEGALADTLTHAARDQLSGWYAWLEKQLNGQDWFDGDRFGWGDLSAAPFVGGAIGLGFGPKAGSALATWFDRAMSRPAVKSTLDEAFAFDRGSVDMAALVAAGLFKREYRDHRLEWMIKSGGLEVVAKGLQADNIRFTGVFP